MMEELFNDFSPQNADLILLIGRKGGLSRKTGFST
jgi:hypothetical protein